MKKNPGRRDHRWMIKKNRTSKSDKKQAINERKMLWLSRGRNRETRAVGA